jgi:hypothetical protein
MLPANVLPPDAKQVRGVAPGECNVVLTKDIHFWKLRMISLDYRREAWAPITMALDVIVTFSWMAFLGFGLIALIFWAFRMLA